MPVSTLRAPTVSVARDGLMSLDAAAAYLHMAPGTLKHWIAQRRIDHVKVGRLTRFTKEQLDRYIASQTVAARGERP